MPSVALGQKGHRRGRIAAIDVASHAQMRGVIGPGDVAQAMEIIAAVKPRGE